MKVYQENDDTFIERIFYIQNDAFLKNNSRKSSFEI